VNRGCSRRVDPLAGSPPWRSYDFYIVFLAKSLSEALGSLRVVSGRRQSLGQFLEVPPEVGRGHRNAFAEMRRRMDAERKPPDARSVRVVRFVERLRNERTAENPTFGEMCRRWNEEHSEEAFSEARSFETAYRRTAKVLHRKYNTEIKREETSELRRQRARVRRERERILERFTKYLT
jgi:hypothetical protein